MTKDAHPIEASLQRLRAAKEPSASDPFAKPIVTDRLSIRRAERADRATVAALWNDASFKRMLPKKAQDGLPPDRTYLDSASSSIIKAGRLLVMEEAGRLVGTINLVGQDPAAPAIGWYVAPAERGRGLASEAAAGVIGRLIDEGVPAVHVGMFADNTESRRIVERLGFGTAPDGDGGHLAFVMTAALWHQRIAEQTPMQ